VSLLQHEYQENALPQTAKAVVNCRLLPDDSKENVMQTIKNVLADTSISVTCSYSSFHAPLSLLRDDVTVPVVRLATLMWPGVTVSAAMSTGATDGKYLRMKGIPVYGISGMFGEMDDVRAHGKDERILAKSFYEGVEFMYGFIKALSTDSK